MTTKSHEKAVTYYVNGETEETTSSDLKVGAILESAGFTPITDYTLKSENPPHDYGANYEELVKIHPNERFQALFKGTTPTSQH